MKKKIQKSKMTLEGLSLMTRREFGAVRQGMTHEFNAARKETADEFAAVREEMADEFSAVRQEMADEFTAVRKEMKDEFIMVRKEMNDGFTAVRKETANEITAVKKDMILGFQNIHVSMERMREELKKEYRKTIKSNDKLITELDVIRKDQAAHDALHIRTDDTLLDHEKRLRKVEQKTV